MDVLIGLLGDKWALAGGGLAVVIAAIVASGFRASRRQA